MDDATVNTACTDAEEAEFRRVVGPMVRPLITVIASSIEAARDILEDPDTGIDHHVQNIEDALLVLAKIVAEKRL